VDPVVSVLVLVVTLGFSTLTEYARLIQLIDLCEKEEKINALHDSKKVENSKITYSCTIQ